MTLSVCDEPPNRVPWNLPTCVRLCQLWGDASIQEKEYRFRTDGDLSRADGHPKAQRFAWGGANGTGSIDSSLLLNTSDSPGQVPDTMTSGMPHICVCACTYKRPDLVKRLLKELADQETDGLFTYSIVVVDNDKIQSAKAVVTDIASGSPIPIKYYVEPRQNISMARNRAIENAECDFVAFIDDDEFPARRWLLTLFEALHKYQVDGVLGPVKPYFDVEPPRWVLQSRLYDRPTYATGLVIDWRKGRTGNVLLRRQIFTAGEQHFAPEFLTGEDQDFFRRMIDKGHVFIWCNEALAYEIEPPIRWKRTYILRRALLRGKISIVHPTFGFREIAESLVAVPAYIVVLPFALVLGHGKFMRWLVKLFDHIGRLLALLGINPVGESYSSE